MVYLALLGIRFLGAVVGLRMEFSPQPFHRRIEFGGILCGWQAVPKQIQIIQFGYILSQLGNY